jgi:RHS repeat-associated protein
MAPGGVGSGGTLYHFGRRYYDPTTGRWTQPDTIDQPASLRDGNLYLYTGNDPINYVDPTGCFTPQGYLACIRACMVGNSILVQLRCHKIAQASPVFLRSFVEFRCNEVGHAVAFIRCARLCLP